MDAIVLLKNDHKAVEKLFKQYEKGKESASAEQKRKLVDEMLTDLTQHTYIEETIFYPASRAADPDSTDQVLESIEEHHVVAWLLSELQHLNPSDETFDAKVTVLMENVRHHVKEEEEDWFPEIRKAMGRKQLAELGERMEAAKSDAPSDPLRLPSAKA